MDFQYCKLEIFIPETHLSALQKALQTVDAGHSTSVTVSVTDKPS